MKHVAQPKKTIIIAALFSVMSVSLLSSSQAGALSLRDITTGLFGGSQQNQQQQQNNQTRILPPVTQQTPVTQQPTQTAPVQQTTPVQAETTPQPVAPQQTITRTVTPQPVVAVTPVDTAADVLSTVNAQSGAATSAKGSPYTSNKIDPQLAEYLKFAGVAAIIIGILMYTSTLFASDKAVHQKTLRHIPVKSN